MVLLTNLFRISVPCGRHNVVPIENPLYFHSFNHFFGWVGSTKMIPFPPTCAQSSVENFSACGELNFSPIVNYSFDWLINSFDYLWQTECCANRKLIVFSKVMIITLDNYQADIIFWEGGTKMISLPARCEKSSVENFSACSGLNFFKHPPLHSCLTVASRYHIWGGRHKSDPFPCKLCSTMC